MENPWTQKDLDRFWSKIEKAQGCWNWKGPVASHGYGRFTRGKQWEETSHRIAYALSHGPIPKGLVVRHRCDNRLCCNPAHLELGSQARNIQDMFQRGGTRRLRLTYEQAAEIRERALAGERGIDLAAEYGVTPSTVSVIKLGKQWQEAYHREY
jgi:hypothetical protein